MLDYRATHKENLLSGSSGSIEITPLETLPGYYPVEKFPSGFTFYGVQQYS